VLPCGKHAQIPPPLEGIPDLSSNPWPIWKPGSRFSKNGGAHSAAATEAPRVDSAETLAAVASLEATVASLTSRYDGRLSTLETHVKEHDARLKELPTLAQVVSTMEEMLSSTMSGLDQKLSDQVKSIEVLKTTVAQSDELMERVLDSIYSLQNHVAENDKSEVPVSV